MPHETAAIGEGETVASLLSGTAVSDEASADTAGDGNELLPAGVFLVEGGGETAAAAPMKDGGGVSSCVTGGPWASRHGGAVMSGGGGIAPPPCSMTGGVGA